MRSAAKVRKDAEEGSDRVDTLLFDLPTLTFRVRSGSVVFLNSP